MFGALEWSYVVALLGACLIALLLVLVARREANAVREQANRDANEVRAHLKERAEQLAAQEQRVNKAEMDIAAERRRVRKQRQRNEQRERELVVERRNFVAQRLQSQQEYDERLEALAGISQGEARKILERSVMQSAHRNVAKLVAGIEREARETAEEKARNIVLSAIQRLAVPVSSSSSVTSITLPQEDMRGRIIGKEGRNIRAFEAASGVDVLIEDDSMRVVLASFDPKRREIATIAMEELLHDGRINPHRIEEAVERAAITCENRDRRAGQQAAEQADVHHLADEVLDVMGSLRLRTSYGQSVLIHSIEVAQIAAGIAQELGADVQLAARAGFLHDIGKAFTGNLAGTHALNGAHFLADHGELDDVVSAVAAHHDEAEHTSIESVIVQIADAISAARPGARRDETTQLVERMHRLEQLAIAMPGVSRALAMSAGRELRVVVEPTEISDEKIGLVARDIARAIEEEIGRFGVVTVTVVRELRAVAATGDNLATRAEETEPEFQDEVSEDTEPRRRI